MGDKSAIEWTDATWNPVTGCTEVSPGCDHCYAARVARGRLQSRYLENDRVVGGDPDDPFAVRLWSDRLEQPLRWREPRMIFVNSMSDLFHKAIPAEFVSRIWRVMLEADWHIYQVLTKRPARAATLIRQLSTVLPLPPHIWVGTSVENQAVYYRMRHLLEVRAAVRFLSCEPLLGPIELGDDSDYLSYRLPDWVIVGGESGPSARPMNPNWVRSLRDQCLAFEIPFFFKQWGGRTPKGAGRQLDGEEWNQWPDGRE